MSNRETQWDRDVKSGRVNPEFEPKSDGRTLPEYLQFCRDNKEMLEESFSIGIQILDELDKKNITKENFARLLGVSILELKQYLGGEYDFSLNLDVKEKIERVLDIKFITL